MLFAPTGAGGFCHHPSIKFCSFEKAHGKSQEMFFFSFSLCALFVCFFPQHLGLPPFCRRRQLCFLCVAAAEAASKSLFKLMLSTGAIWHCNLTLSATRSFDTPSNMLVAPNLGTK